MRYFATHAGKAVLAITGAAILLAAPTITLPYVMAVILLQYGVKQLKLAFREVDRGVIAHVVAPENRPLPESHDGQRGIAGAGNGAIRTRS